MHNDQYQLNFHHPLKLQITIYSYVQHEFGLLACIYMHSLACTSSAAANTYLCNVLDSLFICVHFSLKLLMLFLLALKVNRVTVALVFGHLQLVSYP